MSRLIDADALAEIFADRTELIAERYGIDSSEAGILSGAYKLLESMPTITTDQHWIPCSERLPEKNGRYLVTRGLNAIGALWNRVYIVNYSDLMGIKSTKIFWIGNVGKLDFERIEDVIAWMPLPEPYKEPAP